MRTTLSCGAGLALACCALLLPACGGDGPTRPTTTTTTLPPPPPAPEVVTQIAGAVPAEEGRFVPFTTTRTGRLDVTVDWTFATNDIDIALVRGEPCTEQQLEDNTCQVVAFSDSETAKPETLNVPNASAGSYTLYAFNLGPGDESAAFQVLLTPNASGTSAQSPRSGERAKLKRALRGLRELR